MIKKTAFLRIIGIFIIFIYIFITFFLWRTNFLAKADIAGNFIQNETWNNYGKTIKLYQGQRLVASALTSLNGYFQFSKLRPGTYQLLFFDKNNYFIDKKEISYTKESININIKYQDKYHHPLFLNEIFSLFISLALIFFSFNLLIKVASSLAKTACPHIKVRP